MPETLYDRDFQLWIEHTIDCLKNREFQALDIDSLIEELTDLGKSEKTTLTSNLIILLSHLLKLKVQHDAPNSMKNSWYNSTDEHRQRVHQSLQDTPSLKRFLPEAIQGAYPKARKLAIKEGKRAAFGVRIPQENQYPSDCPFSIEQILDENFYG
jgi:hypothetical protein